MYPRIGGRGDRASSRRASPVAASLGQGRTGSYLNIQHLSELKLRSYSLIVNRYWLVRAQEKRGQSGLALIFRTVRQG